MTKNMSNASVKLVQPTSGALQRGNNEAAILHEDRWISAAMGFVLSGRLTTAGWKMAKDSEANRLVCYS